VVSTEFFRGALVISALGRVRNIGSSILGFFLALLVSLFADFLTDLIRSR
jgi:hypothetical protein